MMFSSVARSARSVNNRVRHASGFASTLYENVWGKSTARYIAYVVVGCVALETVYGTVTTSIWESVNKGKLYKDIDWSKFKSEEEEEEE